MNTQNNFDTFVTNQEAKALKEMIFQRARERVATMTNDIENAYTNSTQNDIMDMARESFITDVKNPFAKIMEDTYEKSHTKEEEITNNIGFPARKIEEKEMQTACREKINTENIVQMRETMMNSVSAEFASPNRGFLGALDFLNSQASVSLFKKNGKELDINA